MPQKRLSNEERKKAYKKIGKYKPKLNKILEVFGKMDITARIESVSKLSDRNGDNYWLVTLEGGEVISTWDFDLIEDCEKGKEYTFPIEKSGKYNNLSGLAVPTIPTDRDVKPDESKKFKNKTDWNEERLYKNRISALSCACECYGSNPLIKDEDIIATARTFFDYIAEG